MELCVLEHQEKTTRSVLMHPSAWGPGGLSKAATVCITTTCRDSIDNSITLSKVVMTPAEARALATDLVLMAGLAEGMDRQQG